tara:strand:- start:204 stop:377 length:174 start_codon:yes stop_codon:yes gene_type:complete
MSGVDKQTEAYLLIAFERAVSVSHVHHEVAIGVSFLNAFERFVFEPNALPARPTAQQ